MVDWDMTITQTVEIPESRQLTINIPSECPTGKANIIIQFSDSDKIILADASNKEVVSAGEKILDKHIEAFKALAK